MMNHNMYLTHINVFISRICLVIKTLHSNKTFETDSRLFRLNKESYSFIPKLGYTYFAVNDKDGAIKNLIYCRSV